MCKVLNDKFQSVFVTEPVDNFNIFLVTRKEESNFNQ